MIDTKPCESWSQVQNTRDPLYYHAPLDAHPRRVERVKAFKNGKVRFRVGRDTWTVDESHLSRFSTPLARLKTQPGTLHDYSTGEYLRDATQEETDESIAAARTDGGAGVILVDGRSCYVEGGVES